MSAGTNVLFWKTSEFGRSNLQRRGRLALAWSINLKHSCHPRARAHTHTQEVRGAGYVNQLNRGDHFTIYTYVKQPAVILNMYTF